MPIKPICNWCNKELQKEGAILFAPPKLNICVKYHMCVRCFNKIKPKE